MQDRTIYITRFDLERLENLLATTGEFSYRNRGDHEEPAAELQKGRRVDSKKFSSNVVAMNARGRRVHVTD